MTDQAQPVEFQVAEGREIDPATWAATAAHVRESITADELPESAMADVMNGFRFLDGMGATWTYDGSRWQRWDGQVWAAQTPPASLRLQPFTLDWLPPDPSFTLPAGVDPGAAAPAVRFATPQPDASPAPTAAAPAPAAPAPVPAPDRPTHRVPAGGMPAWANPDPASAATLRLEPGLPVMVVEAFPNGWTRVRASNGWTGWVDGRLLTPG